MSTHDALINVYDWFVWFLLYDGDDDDGDVVVGDDDDDDDDGLFK